MANMLNYKIVSQIKVDKCGNLKIMKKPIKINSNAIIIIIIINNNDNFILNLNLIFVEIFLFFFYFLLDLFMCCTKIELV